MVLYQPLCPRSIVLLMVLKGRVSYIVPLLTFTDQSFVINKDASPFSHRPAQPPLWTFSSLRTWQPQRPLQLRRSARQLRPGRLGSRSGLSGWPIRGWKRRTRGESLHLTRLPRRPERARLLPVGPPGRLPPAGAAAVAAVAGQPRRQPERPEWSRPVTKDGYRQLFKVSMYDKGKIIKNWSTDLQQGVATFWSQGCVISLAQSRITQLGYQIYVEPSWAF